VARRDEEQVLPAGSNAGWKSLERGSLTRDALRVSVLYSQIPDCWLAPTMLYASQRPSGDHV